MPKQSNQPASIIPERGERALIVGQTGSGKTLLCVWMLKRIPRGPIIIYDTKNEPKFSLLKPSIIANSWDAVTEAYNNGENDYIIFRPPSDLIGDAQALDDFLFRHYIELEGIDCYIDELKNFHANGRAYKGLINLLERGRSRGITTIMSTQRPSWISLSTLSEAQKIFILYLKNTDDIKRMGKFVPDIEDKPRLAARGYQFYYYDEIENRLTLFDPVRLDNDLKIDETEQDAIAEPDADRKRRLIWS